MTATGATHEGTIPPLVSVVIPVFEEADGVISLLDGVAQELDPLGITYELFLVDDGSEDETWQTLVAQAKRRPNLRALRLSRNFGKEYALCAGLEQARGQAVVVMDGDLQHPPSLLPQMIQAWQAGGVDIVEAVKTVRGDESFWGQLSAAVFYRLIDRLTGYELNNASDFKLLDRRVLHAWLGMREHNLFFKGMVAWLGFRRVQLPFEVPHRVMGHSKWTWFQLFNLAVTAITAFSAIPLHTVSLMGVFFLGFAVLLGIQTLYHKLAGVAVDGFTTVILLQLIMGSIMMFSLGIIGEYLARIYTEVKGRPRYIVAETLNNQPVEQAAPVAAEPAAPY